MRRVFPNEVLHEILALFCGEFIDSLIVSAYDPENEVTDSNSDARGGDSLESTSPETIGTSKEGSNPPEANAIVSLLQTSYRVREMTLSILSQGMSIPRGDDGR